MIKSVKDNITSLVDTTKALKSVEKFLTSPWFLAIFAVFVFVAQMFGGDLIGFTVCALLFVYICLFCKSTKASIPILCMAVFCVSTKNSPAKLASGFHLLGKYEYYVGNSSTFYASSQFIFTASVLAAMVLTALVFRLVVFGDFKRAFSFKNLLIGIAFMSVGFLMAGIEVDKEDSGWFFGLVQAATFFLIYLFYASTLDYESFDLNFVANVMLTIMLYNIALIGYIYATRFYGFLEFTGEWKGMICCGWGVSLDFGSYIAMCMPACFYKLLKGKKVNVGWLLLAVLGIIAIFFVMARGALVMAVLEFLVGCVLCLKEKRTRNAVVLTILSLLFVALTTFVVLLATDTLSYVFEYFIKKGESTDITSGRLKIWERYLGYFLEHPIFGGGFGVDLEYRAHESGNPHNGVFNIYSYLAHNVLVQSIASCGIFGTFTLFVHFGTLTVMIFRKPSLERSFLALAIVGFLGMSLLDTIFFKAQFTFLYLALLVTVEADVFRKEQAIEREENKRRDSLHGDKPRVVFSFVEAGMGHIMPMQSLADAFERKYGKYCIVVRSKFFNETNEEPLLALEQSFVKEVKKYNHNWLYGYFNMFLMQVFGVKFLSNVIMDAYIPGARVCAMSHMQNLAPDMVVSTHWSTNYYAERIQHNKPITVTYIPDVQTIPLFRYPCDMTLMSTERGYGRAREKHKKRYNDDNIRLVDFAIREEAFSLCVDGKGKKERRHLLGLDEEKRTLVLFEGGYGLGKMGKIVQLLVEKDLPLNVVAICGKNEKLYKQLKGLTVGKNVCLLVEGFCEKTLEYLSVADVFLGKAGASSVAEATFFGLALIITKYATSMERDNAEYYLQDVKNALRIFNVEDVVDKIENWMNNPEELIRLQENALLYRNKFGSEKSADVLWELLCDKYPKLKKTTVEEQENKTVDKWIKKQQSKKKNEKRVG